MKKNIVLVVIVVLLFWFNMAHATIWYVHPDSTLNLIQAGLDSCNTGDTVLVAPGIYYENISWPNTQNIHLESERTPDTTIIDGASMDRVILIDTGVDSFTVISGFTIRNGEASTEGGGGISCESNSSPTISYNIITGNHADHGGGINCYIYSSPLIRNNTITNNTSDNEGGGINCYDNSSPMIHRNTIDSNTGVPGAGIAVTAVSFPNIDSCSITNNTGDGVYCGGGNAVINYNNITDNSDYGVRNSDPNFTVDAEYNWWGDASGPGGVGPGSGDEVSQWVDYDPWLDEPVGVEEEKTSAVNCANFGATIFCGPLLLPEGKMCKVYDVTGRNIIPDKIKPGIYFIEIDNKIVQKVIKVK